MNQPVEEQNPPKPKLTKKQIDRITQPAMAMLLTLLVTLAIVLPIILINPASRDNNYDPQIDVHKLAAEGSPGTPITLAAPEVPEQWKANYARWQRDARAEVDYWEVGYLTEKKAFAGFVQAVSANPSWMSEKTQKAQPVGTTEAAGRNWEVRVPQDGPAKDTTYWVLKDDAKPLPKSKDGKPQTLILLASGGDEDLKLLAEEVLNKID